MSSSGISHRGENPLLCIAIPTWNRAQFLDLCLCGLADEISSLSPIQRNQVFVYVYNNASTDETVEVIQKYLVNPQFSIKVVTHSENIGAHRNVALCYANAVAPYIWVMGDDDVILPGTLLRVLKLLEPRDVDILYLNGYSYMSNFKNETPPAWSRQPFRRYPDALAFVRNTHVMLTFLTAMIVRSGVDTRPMKEQVEGSFLPQLAWVLPLIRDGKIFLSLGDWAYAAKHANSGGYDAVDVFAGHLNRIAVDVFANQLRLAQAIENGVIINWFPIYILTVIRGRDLDLRRNLALRLRNYLGHNWRYKVFLAPLLVLPTSVSKIYFLFLRLVRKTLGIRII